MYHKNGIYILLRKNAKANTVITIFTTKAHAEIELSAPENAQMGAEAKAYSVASFYENFSFEEKGKYIIKICDGTACHVRKSMPILDYLYKTLKLNAKKHTTEDALFTVETVSCLGACGLAPAITVNEKVYPKMSPEKMKKLLEEIKRGEPDAG